MDPDTDSQLNHMAEPPAKHDQPIGIIGAGFIAADIQLVAYREAGYNVQAIASRTPAHAAEVAARHEIPRVHDTWQELLDDDGIEVVDIAFPPQLQREIIEEAAGKDHVRGILAQKPMAADYSDAVRAVKACEDGPLLAINQNMRYDQSMRALKTLLDRGDLGEPVLATIEMRAIPHWQDFLHGGDRFTLANMSIHHIDVLRYLFGDPEGIYVSARPDPRTEFKHSDGICLYQLEWAEGMRAGVWDDVWTGPVREGLTDAERDNYIKWRVEGTEGLAWGTIGWPTYPVLTPSTLSFASTRNPDQMVHPRWTEVWFPDAFAGTMGALLWALEGEPLVISGRDNLPTMALVEAGYRSIEERRFIHLDEITDGNPA